MTAGQVTSRPAKGSQGMGAARGFAREEHDFYPTPPALIEPLLRVESFPVNLWEPACGDGALSNVLTAHGHVVTSTDLVDRGYGQGRRDFLLKYQRVGDGLITNPPFRLWVEFAEHACRAFTPRFEKIALLGRLQLLEGKRVSALFAETGLSRVWVSAGRVNMLPRGAEDKGHNGMIAWAWFVWERGWTGRPQIGWFSPEKAAR